MRRSLSPAAAVALAAGLIALAGQAVAQTGSGPRTARGGVEFAPVDRRGPTFPANNLLTPDSGWNDNSSGGIAGPVYSTAPPLFAPPPPPKPHGRIILKQGQ